MAGASRRTLPLALLVVAAACTMPAVPPAPMPMGGIDEDWVARYDALARAGEPVIALDPARSEVRIYAYSGGRAPQLGHNHVLTAPHFTGLLRLAPADLGASQFDLEFRLDALQFDPPALRATLGEAFASTLEQDDIARTRAHMLGPDNFQADRYPLVHVRSLEVAGVLPRVAAKVRVTLHGQSQEQWVALQVQGAAAAPDITGSLVLRQSDFGVHPYSALGGLLAVQDEVLVEFHLRGSPRAGGILRPAR